MNLSKISTCILLFAITVCSGFAQIESKTKVAPDSSALLVVTFGVDDKKGDRAGLQDLQTERLHAIEGVRYVSANYKSGQVAVRYQSSKVTLKRLLAELEKLSEDRISLLKEPETIDSSRNIQTFRKGLNVLNPNFSNVSIECLAHDEAHALCEEHLPEDVLKELDLRQCYVVKVDFASVAHVGADYNWDSQACLVDETGKLIKPLSWLELPSVIETQKKSSVSGLLIFPKIPVLKLGLTLRLLRANGEGYDSYTVDVPEN